ncbi:uncharacterized protein LOC103508207 [Diaphorina citri]|uniref:Uncharacterized protein LOC103508207 n=1 Tax=Diaphorina citri TaxID=121845 RepID=A0A1S3CZG8_DIACI|nr:uncharacterized protein LOC103508207 [Diaphorina citri]
MDRTMGKSPLLKAGDANPELQARETVTGTAGTLKEYYESFAMELEEQDWLMFDHNHSVPSNRLQQRMYYQSYSNHINHTSYPLREANVLLSNQAVNGGKYFTGQRP